MWSGGTQPMLLTESSCVYILSFRFVVSRVFWPKYHFWPFLFTMVTIFRIFFSPCFKLGQNLSSCQVSEKFTHRWGKNDGTNIQTER